MGEDGVTIEFLSKEKLETDGFDEKLDFVLEKVKDDAVLVLSEAWTPKEKRELIQASMEQIDDDFPGVEFMGLDPSDNRLERAKSFVFDTVLGQDYRSGLTIVGNSRVMEKMKEEKHSISFLAKLEDDE